MDAPPTPHPSTNLPSWTHDAPWTGTSQPQQLCEGATDVKKKKKQVKKTPTTTTDQLGLFLSLLRSFLCFLLLFLQALL